MISVAYINPVLGAVKRICEQTLKVSISAGKPRLCEVDERVWKLYPLSAAIRLGGAVHGTISLGFSESVALALASGLAGETFETIDDNSRDALGEVANLIVGTAKRDLPGGLVTISTPQILPTHRIEASALPTILLPFETAAGRFVVSVAIAEAPAPAKAAGSAAA